MIGIKVSMRSARSCRNYVINKTVIICVIALFSAAPDITQPDRGSEVNPGGAQEWPHRTTRLGKQTANDPLVHLCRENYALFIGHSTN